MAESVSGYHFISTYQECPRKFLLKYVYHLVPVYRPKALSFGIAIHEALETWAKEDLNKAILKFQNTLYTMEADYEKEVDFQADLARGVQMLNSYETTWREHDTKEYELIGCEVPFEAELVNGFVFTGRIDRVVKEKSTKNVYIIESKTTGYSAGVMAHSVMVKDQSTAYLFGAKKIFPKLNILGVIPDVLYARGSVASCERFTPIIRTDRNIKEFEIQILGQLMNISQRVKNLEKYPWPYLFPRNCGASIFKCDYEDICRLNIRPDDVPIGFKKEKDSEEIVNNLLDVNDIQIIRTTD